MTGLNCRHPALGELDPSPKLLRQEMLSFEHYVRRRWTEAEVCGRHVQEADGKIRLSTVGTTEVHTGHFVKITEKVLPKDRRIRKVITLETIGRESPMIETDSSTLWLLACLTVNWLKMTWNPATC